MRKPLDQLHPVDKAAAIAVKELEGHVDKLGVPIIMHAAAVAAKGRNDAERVLGWLHDIIEDAAPNRKTNMLLRVRYGFGDWIADGLDAISRREDEGYFDYIMRVDAHDLARAVKIHDLRHNLDPDRVANFPSLAERYNRALNLLGEAF